MERLANLSVSTPCSSSSWRVAEYTARNTGVAKRITSSAMNWLVQGSSAQVWRSPNGSGRVSLPPQASSTVGRQVRGARTISRTTSSRPTRGSFMVLVSQNFMGLAICFVLAAGPDVSDEATGPSAYAVTSTRSV